MERRVVRFVDPRSVVRLAFAISAAMAAVVLVGLVALYLLAAASGILGGVEAFVASLGFGEGGAGLVALVVGFVVASLVGSVAVAAAAGLGANLYNILVDIVGGVEVVTAERRQRPR